MALVSIQQVNTNKQLVHFDSPSNQGLHKGDTFFTISQHLKRIQNIYVYELNLGYTKVHFLNRSRWLLGKNEYTASSLHE